MEALFGSTVGHRAPPPPIALNLPFSHPHFLSPTHPYRSSPPCTTSSSSSSSNPCSITRNRKARNSNWAEKGRRGPAIASSMASAETKPFSVLFVCLGNICRSPAAEGVFRDLVKKGGFDSQFTIDSAGTIDYHEGNPADSRMRSAAKRRGIEITSMSRPIRPSDFNEFDLILAMDKQNHADILDAFGRWKGRNKLPDDAYKKVKLMCSYCKSHEEEEVPDPYYGGAQGFEKVLDLLEDACGSLLDSIVSDKSSA